MRWIYAVLGRMDGARTAPRTGAPPGHATPTPGAHAAPCDAPRLSPRRQLPQKAIADDPVDAGIPLHVAAAAGDAEQVGDASVSFRHDSAT
jgi:hypothetical protein